MENYEETLLKDYKSERIKFNFLLITIISMIFVFIIIFVFGGLFRFLWQNNFQEYMLLPRQQRISNALILIAILVPGVFLHELIHGIFYVLYSKNKWKSIKFGVNLKKFVAYCTCFEPIKIKRSIVVAVMPGIITGIIPMIISEITGNIFLLFIGMIFTAAAGGDFYILFFHFIHENREDYTIDKPEGRGMPITYIYRKRKI